MSTTRLQSAKNTPAKNTSSLAKALEEAENVLTNVSKTSAARSISVSQPLTERPVTKEPVAKKQKKVNADRFTSSDSSSSSDTDSDGALGDDTFYKMFVKKA